MHRRQVLRGAPVLLMTAMHGGTARPISAADSLTGIRSEMTDLAADWEQTAPGDAATLLWGLTGRARTLAVGVRKAGRAADWAHTMALLHTMQGQALADAGKPRPAYISAVFAMRQAAAIGDPAVQTHAETIAASVARAANARIDPVLLIARASTRPGGGYGRAIAMTARARMLAGDGPEAAREVLDTVQVAEDVDLGDGPGGFALDGWDPAIRAAWCGCALAAVGLRGPALERLDVAAAALGPGPDGQPAAGAYAMERLFRARSAIEAGQVDQAELLIGEALTIAHDRPSAHVAYGALSLASRARVRHGVRWPEIRQDARKAMPI